jgi:hypothetical protein
MAHPPIKLKQSASTSAAQTLTTSSSAQDARLLVRETLRISANLADLAAQPLFFFFFFFSFVRCFG